MSSKKYTIQDLAAGRVAIRFDDEQDNLQQLKLVLQKAFPKDIGSCEGWYPIYARHSQNAELWDSFTLKDNNLPTQDLRDFKLPDELAIAILREIAEQLAAGNPVNITPGSVYANQIQEIVNEA